MNVERLLKLASFLKTVPPERFNYARWVGYLGPEWKPEETIRLSCGTAACAGGWATAIPEFAELGLKLKSTGIAANGYAFGMFIQFQRWHGFRALEFFFGLNQAEAVDLFSPANAEEEDATPSYVAAKIERFVAEPQGE